MSKGAARGLAAALLLGLGQPGLATPGFGQAPRLEPSDAVACLKHVDAQVMPKYPEELLRRKDGGSVTAEMVFDAPDQPPAVGFGDTSKVSATLVDAVRQYLRGLRTPCLEPPLKATLRQTFVFVPNDGRKVVAETVADAAQARSAELLRCVVRQDRGPPPEYPLDARRKGEQGVVFLEETYVGPNEPPVVKVLAASPGRSLRAAAIDDSRKMRMPCHDGNPLRTTRIYQFRLVDDVRHVLRDAPLRDFLSWSERAPTDVYFDTRDMGCPFDLRLTYYMPHRRNYVEQLEPARAERRPLMDWLSRVALKLPERENTLALGKTMTISVPCATLDF